MGSDQLSKAFFVEAEFRSKLQEFGAKQPNLISIAEDAGRRWKEGLFWRRAGLFHRLRRAFDARFDVPFANTRVAVAVKAAAVRESRLLFAVGALCSTHRDLVDKSVKKSLRVKEKIKIERLGF